jgi:cell division protein FtsZ
LGLHSDSLITVLNSKLESSNPDGLMKEWYYAADDVLKSAVSTIVEIIQSSGYQNVDFRDVVSVMGSNRGRALMGTGRATGSERAKQAAMQAVRSDLLEEENLRTARGVLINITAAEDSMRGREITEIIDTIRNHCSDDVTPIYGTTFDDAMGEELQVTVIVSGIGARNKVTLAGHATDGSRSQMSGLQTNDFIANDKSVIKDSEVIVSQNPMNYRTGTDDVGYTVHARTSTQGYSIPLNLDSPNPAIPTLTQAIETPIVNQTSMNHTVIDTGSLMLNPSSMHNPRADMQNRVKAMQNQGIPTLEIPTFLRNQVN